MLHGAAARAGVVFSVLLFLGFSGIGQAGHVLKTHDIDFEAPVHTLGEPVSWGEDWPPAKRPASNPESMLTVVEGLDGQACQMVPGAIFYLKEWYEYFRIKPYSFTVQSQTFEMDVQIEVTEGEGFLIFPGVWLTSAGEIEHDDEVIGHFQVGERFHLRVCMTPESADVTFNGDVIFAGPDDYIFSLACLQVLSFGEFDGRVLIDNVKVYLETAEPILVLHDPCLGGGVEAGSVYPVRWAASQDLEVLVEYSADYGDTWSSVGTYAGEYGFEWAVPQEPSDFSRLRISDAGAGITSEVRLRVYETPPSLGDYELIDLTALYGEQFFYRDLNDQGSLLAYNGPNGGSFLLSHGMFHPTSFIAHDINNLNQLAGVKQIDGDDYCVLWAEGRERVLFCLNESPEYVQYFYRLHINDSQDVAVHIHDNLYSAPDEMLLWSDGQIQYRGTVGRLDDIHNFEFNNNGMVVGFGSPPYMPVDIHPFYAFQVVDQTIQLFDESTYPGLKSLWVGGLNNAGLACGGGDLLYFDYLGAELEDIALFIQDGKLVFVQDKQFPLGGLADINDHGIGITSYRVQGPAVWPVQPVTKALPLFYNRGELVEINSLLSEGPKTVTGSIMINNQNVVFAELDEHDCLLVPARPEQELVSVAHTLPEVIYFYERIPFRVLGVYEDGFPRDHTKGAEIVFEPNGLLSAEGSELSVVQVPEADVTVNVTMTCRRYGKAVSTTHAVRVAAPEVLRVPSEYTTIQGAIDAAEDGDTVLLADGTYAGDGNRDLSYGGKAITVRSENGPGDCVIDCGGTQHERHFAVQFFDKEGPRSVLQGVTIRGGYDGWGIIKCYASGPSIINCYFTDHICYGGGIIDLDRSDAIIRDCNFTSIASAESAVISMYDSNTLIQNCHFTSLENAMIKLGYESSAVLEDCRFIGNSGGIVVNGGQIECAGCVFEGNRSAGSLYWQLSGESFFRDCIFKNNMTNGSSLFMIQSVTGGIEGCLFENNTSVCDYAMIGLYPSSAMTLRECRIIGNEVYSTGAEHAPALLSLLAKGGNGTIQNCLFAGNRGCSGGVISASSYRGEYPIHIINCSLIHNQTNSGGTIHGFGAVRVNNCILRNGGGEIVKDAPEASVAVSYTNLTGGWEGVGNLDVDPLFVREGYWDPNGTPGVLEDDVWVSGDYHLQSAGWRWDTARGAWTWDEATSLCVDAGCPGDGLGEEPTAVAADPLGRWGANVRIDMGCYGGTVEAGMAPPGWRRLSDVTNDWRTDADDLAVLAGQWLEAAAGLGGDLDRSGGVGLGDLAAMAREWEVGM